VHGYSGSSSASLTGFQLGATSAVRTTGLPVSGSVASAPTIGLNFSSSEIISSYALRLHCTLQSELIFTVCDID